MTKKNTLVYLTQNRIYRIVYKDISENEELRDFEESSLIEWRPIGIPSKYISKKDQIEILEIIKEWQREATPSEDNQYPLLISTGFYEIEANEGILQHLSFLFKDTQIERFSRHEDLRQSFLWFKYYTLNSQNNQSKILFLDIGQLQTDLLIGDSTSINKISTAKCGIQQITDFIIESRKQGGEQYLTPVFVEGNLSKLIEHSYLYNSSSQILVLDENTSYVLMKILNRHVGTQKLQSDLIFDLSQLIIESNFEYIRQIECIDSEAADYVSAMIILLAEILNSFSLKHCILSLDCRFKGYILYKHAESNKLKCSLAEYSSDWKKSAKEILLQYAPEEFMLSLHVANLGIEIVDSAEGLLHFWENYEKKLLWLSCFFHSLISTMDVSLAEFVLSKLLSLNTADYLMIIAIIKIANKNNVSQQSKYLDITSANSRDLVKKLSAIVKLAISLNSSGRSIVKSAKIEPTRNKQNILRLFVYTRSDASAELIELKSNKRSFEMLFEQELEIEVMNA